MVISLSTPIYTLIPYKGVGEEPSVILTLLAGHDTSIGNNINRRFIYGGMLK